jgi:pimeloyl-ACP methyl ester carboxylesterase
MPITVVNGVHLYWEEHGAGPPVVLVHGSWGDHRNWDPVVSGLARAFRPLTYDRRGHSASERPAGQGSIDEDVMDLALLMAARQLAPAHVVGNSFGGSVVLKLALARPDLFASLTVHEPPLVGLLGDDPGLPALQQRMEAVIATLRSGDAAAGARQFVETVALGPGMWDALPSEMQQVFVFNAPTWVDEMMEPGAFWLDVGRLAAFDRPALITGGDQSPPFFGAILGTIGDALPHARRHTFHGAGHVPHLTHADDFVRVVGGFIGSLAAAG